MATPHRPLLIVAGVAAAALVIYLMVGLFTLSDF